MRSARKAVVGDPFATGAGALDILAALTTNGSVSKAPSPKVSRESPNKLNIEDTAVLWSNSSFGLHGTCGRRMSCTRPRGRAPAC